MGALYHRMQARAAEEGARGAVAELEDAFAQMTADLAHLREQAGPDSCAAVMAERDELRERWTCHACSLDVSPPVSEDDEPTVLCRECAEQMRTERDALRDALRPYVRATVVCFREDGRYAEILVPVMHHDAAKELLGDA